MENDLVRTVKTLNLDFFVQCGFAFVNCPRRTPFPGFYEFSSIQPPAFVLVEFIDPRIS
jgi:hypothetical protein